MANVFIYGPYGFKDYSLVKKHSVNLLKDIEDVNLILFTCSIARFDDLIIKLSGEMQWPITKVNGVEDVAPICDLGIIFKSKHCPECNEIINYFKKIPNRIINVTEDEDT